MSKNMLISLPYFLYFMRDLMNIFIHFIMSYLLLLMCLFISTNVMHIIAKINVKYFMMNFVLFYDAIIGIILETTEEIFIIVDWWI